MNRRGFLRRTSLVGLAAFIAPDLVRGLPGRLTPLTGSALSASALPSGYGNPALIWELNGRAIAVATYGSPLEAIRGNGWRGSGINFLMRGPASEWQPIRGFSEAQPEIEFWVTEDGLEIEQAGIDAKIGEKPRLSPGVRLQFPLDPQQPREFDLEVEFPAEARRLREIGEVEAEMAAVTAPLPEPRIYQLLDELNASAFLFPAEALEKLPALKAKNWSDGEIAEWLTDIGRDAKLVRAAKGVKVMYRPQIA